MPHFPVAAARREWSDRFIPAYRKILASLLIKQADHIQDSREATDMIVFAGTIACKTRRHSYYERFPHDFGLRNRAPAPFKSEYDKIRSGFADRLLYTFCDPSETFIEHWWLLDMHVFRNAAKYFFSGVDINPIHIPAKDIHVTTINWKTFPKKYGEILLASSESSVEMELKAN